MPNIRDAKTVAVTISDTQWEDVLWNREEEEQGKRESANAVVKDNDDIYAYGHDDIPVKEAGDWYGMDRDRRSAYLIMGALKSEGIL